MSEPEKKKGCSCIGKGCVFMAIIGVVLLALGLRSCGNFAVWLRAHASNESVEVPVENATQDEYEALVKKLDAFKNATSAGQTLELNAHDLNVLIAFSPDWHAVRGKIRVTIEKDQIGLIGSLPMTAIPPLADKYLNGEIYFTLSMDDRVPHLSVQDIKLKQGALTADEVKKFSTYGIVYLTNSMLGDPVLGPVFTKAKTIKVKDGVIVLKQD